jgi:hypothetical protein
MVQRRRRTVVRWTVVIPVNARLNVSEGGVCVCGKHVSPEWEWVVGWSGYDGGV